MGFWLGLGILMIISGVVLLVANHYGDSLIGNEEESTWYGIGLFIVGLFLVAVGRGGNQQPTNQQPTNQQPTKQTSFTCNDCGFSSSDLNELNLHKTTCIKRRF